MLTFLQGNLFDSQAEAWVNPVNCLGVMGKGIALQFKERFPEVFRAYRKLCLEYGDGLSPGKLHVCLLSNSSTPRAVINFPTKHHWRDPSKYAYVIDGLKSLTVAIKDDNFKSVAIPALGCGNGGLNWKIVKSCIAVWHSQGADVLADVDIQVYEPQEGN